MDNSPISKGFTLVELIIVIIIPYISYYLLQRYHVCPVRLDFELYALRTVISVVKAKFS
ncbi:prepilin-type N-terminal cleavage/methylation domain-containing protein [Vibrio lentus]|nr:prepilin-type N-terminal cleavage/methylation domain-containing protein [Vibrio lentus]